MKVEISYDISAQQLCDLIVTSFEGGSNSWLHSAELKRSDNPPKPGLVWWGTHEVFEGDYEFEVGFDDPDEEEGAGNGRKLINPAEMLAGMWRFAEENPTDFGDFIRGEYDADTADLFMQLLVLGEVVYG